MNIYQQKLNCLLKNKLKNKTLSKLQRGTVDCEPFTVPNYSILESEQMPITYNQTMKNNISMAYSIDLILEIMI